jgi:hypothetical protein
MKVDRESHTIKTNKMKKITTFIIILSAVFLSGYSQNVDDALRYSQVFYYGSARFMGMGGAFTALGGDLSAISLNPASTGVFRSFELSISPQMYYNNSSATWNNSKSTDFRYTMNLSHAGGVFNLLPGTKETGLVCLNLAYSYNKTNNFNENTTISGISENSSMADYWLGKADGIFYKDLRGAVGIVYDVWIIDTVSNSGASRYASIFSNYGASTNATYGQTIKRVIQNDGNIGYHAISVGGNLSNKFYFGATLNISVLKYTGHYQHLEADYNNVIFDFKNFTYTDHFEASGTGYSFNLGAIYRPVDFIRLGGALHTPVVYRISENFYDNVTSLFDNNDKYERSNDPLKYKYTFTTPFRVNGGVAFQIKKFALLSADYEFADYKMAQFSKASDDYDYSIENQDIKNILKSASNMRFGAEFRIKNIYLRSGYSYYGKAFASGEDNQKLNYNGISIGFGMRQQNFYFDMAFSSLFSNSKYFMYNDPPYLEAAAIRTNKNTFTTTFGFKF